MFKDYTSLPYLEAFVLIPGIDRPTAEAYPPHNLRISGRQGNIYVKSKSRDNGSVGRYPDGENGRRYAKVANADDNQNIKSLSEDFVRDDMRWLNRHPGISRRKPLRRRTINMRRCSLDMNASENTCFESPEESHEPTATTTTEVSNTPLIICWRHVLPGQHSAQPRRP
ncbi:hypothetical protein EVAR_924_1 [Eumeta japonica]|uniref:Uncharacterized protein n=1 Tax=Eumeta variegata TaxID=151549 RepID=A0A4C1SE09_EUMVA|nr:hypothetical protein EVAR_924_1 [Eumeta japonica]